MHILRSFPHNWDFTNGKNNKETEMKKAKGKKSGSFGTKGDKSAGASCTHVDQKDMLHDATNSTNLKEYRDGQGMGSVVNPVITGKK